MAALGGSSAQQQRHGFIEPLVAVRDARGRKQKSKLAIRAFAFEALKQAAELAVKVACFSVLAPGTIPYSGD
ncbi:hypothetical protein IVB30_31925 [Bradyrhizobium sp. 200]|uniref:hypothetical protein n=1 Tax=Bradyrhizobium sp. 200 TaxID=2782665 RepID=UPI001FFEDD64|nr:hypothetical protein [Bradyrhizobium sp. 200]UPJ47791.1 hypothetical protein IVB30_31925 [Bradyrhizobium sp. 200]